MATKNKADIRRGVHSRIRKKVRGSADRPRLAVFRSLNHIYAQLIDDDSGKTLATASTTEKSLGGATGETLLQHSRSERRLPNVRKRLAFRRSFTIAADISITAA